MQPLNSPLEAGVHAVLMLEHAWPSSLDVDQMALMEHVMMYGLDGASGLYPHIPFNTTGLAVRRSNIALGVQIFERAGYAERQAADGFTLYVASEEASHFVSLLESPESSEIAAHCRAAVDQIRALNDSALTDLYRSAIARDIEELRTISDGEA